MLLFCAALSPTAPLLHAVVANRHRNRAAENSSALGIFFHVRPWFCSRWESLLGGLLVNFHLLTFSLSKMYHLQMSNNLQQCFPTSILFFDIKVISTDKPLFVCWNCHPWTNVSQSFCKYVCQSSALGMLRSVLQKKIAPWSSR